MIKLVSLPENQPHHLARALFGAQLPHTISSISQFRVTFKGHPTAPVLTNVVPEMEDFI